MPATRPRHSSPHHVAAAVRRSPAERRRPDPLVVLLAVTALVVLLALLAPPARAYELRLTTANDLLVTDRDDLYTFAVELQMQQGPFTFALREQAFTDRAAGVRFDETQLSLGGQLPSRLWSVSGEIGVVHVGEGVFGEEAQNAVHDLIGGEEVVLPYTGSSLHGRGALTAERSFALGRRLEGGPRFEVEVIPGVRSHAIAGGQLAWSPHRRFAVHAVLGWRVSDVSVAALEPHVVTEDVVARIGVVLAGRLAIDWSYNDFGDGREHLSLGWRVTTGARPGWGR